MHFEVVYSCSKFLFYRGSTCPFHAGFACTKRVSTYYKLKDQDVLKIPQEGTEHLSSV